jgi:hypothetical protein
MGFLTTITIYNDSFDLFQKNPEEFGRTLVKAISENSSSSCAKDVSFGYHCNAISLQPSKHADDNTVYLHSGNCVVDVGAYSKQFNRAPLSYQAGALDKIEGILEQATIQTALNIVRSQEWKAYNTPIDEKVLMMNGGFSRKTLTLAKKVIKIYKKEYKKKWGRSP